MQRRIALMLAAALFGAAGCGVKKETHQKVLDELTATQGELEATRKERDRLKTENDALADKLGLSDKERGKLVKDREATEKELAELRKQREAAEKRLQAFRDLKQRFAKLVDTGKLKVVFRKGQMILELPSGILFASGQAELSKDGQAALTEVLNVLAEFKDRRFAIAGHTDTDPIKSKKFKSNWELSTARALTVVQFMVKAGFPATNVSAVGFGEFDPVAPNDTDANKQLNRRIEIVLVPDLSELPTLTGAEP
jgi:chemotaxis protein MotB